MRDPAGTGEEICRQGRFQDSLLFLCRVCVPIDLEKRRTSSSSHLQRLKKRAQPTKVLCYVSALCFFLSLGLLFWEFCSL